MNLPNYFLADLPPEATLSPAMITEACQTLKRNREQYLAGRSTEQLIKTLNDVAECWLQPENSYPEMLKDEFDKYSSNIAIIRRVCNDFLLRNLSPHFIEQGHARVVIGRSTANKSLAERTIELGLIGKKEREWREKDTRGRTRD